MVPKVCIDATATGLSPGHVNVPGRAQTKKVEGETPKSICVVEAWQTSKESESLAVYAFGYLVRGLYEFFLVIIKCAMTSSPDPWTLASRRHS
jgi:hypothetical protein